MTTPIVLPKLGFSVNEATIAEWLAEAGASVVLGQPLYLMESEKSVQEIEAPVSGRLKIIKVAGESYPVGTVVGEIE